MSTTKVSTAMSDAQTRNDIINGGLVVNQENVTAPTDADFTIGDLFLHNGEGTPVMSLETDGPQGTRPWQKMVLDANAQGGLAYIVPNDTVQDYIANGKMSFGIKLKTTAATISNARIGVIKWTGTADAVTKELVGTWASDGTNPTLATSLSYENTPANVGLTTSWVRHTVEDVTVDSDTTNIVIFIWTNDGTITASDVIGFSEWQLNPGATVDDFSSPDRATVMDQVDLYLQRYNYDTTSAELICVGGTVNSASEFLAKFEFRKEFLNIPTITSSAFGTFAGRDGASTVVGTSISFLRTGRFATVIALGSSSGWGTYRPGEFQRNSTNTTFLQFDARIGV